MRRIDEQHVAAREFGEDTRGRVLDPLDPEGMQAFQATQERARIGFNRSDAHCAIEEAPVDVGGEQGRITAAYFDQALRLPVAQERKQRARIGLAELGVLQPVSVIVVVRARRVIESGQLRSEEHTSELPSQMRISYAVFCLKKKKILQKLQEYRH